MNRARASATAARSRARDHGVRNSIRPQTSSTSAIRSSEPERSPEAIRSAIVCTTLPNPWLVELHHLSPGFALEEPLGGAGEQAFEGAGGDRERLVRWDAPAGRTGSAGAAPTTWRGRRWMRPGGRARRCRQAPESSGGRVSQGFGLAWIGEGTAQLGHKSRPSTADGGAGRSGARRRDRARARTGRAARRRRRATARRSRRAAAGPAWPRRRTAGVPRRASPRA